MFSMQRTILSSAHAFWSKLPEISYTNYKCRSSVFGVSPSEANNTSLFRPTTAARLEETNQQKTCFQVFVQKLRNSQIASGLEQFVMARRLVQKWQQYKYRFVPWIAMNLGSARRVPSEVDKAVTDERVDHDLRKLFRAIHNSHSSNLSQHDDNSPKNLDERNENQKQKEEKTSKNKTAEKLRRWWRGDKMISAKNLNIMDEVLGFCIERQKSTISQAGRGVFVTKGSIPAGAVVAMYPGLIYNQGDPVLFQSARNPFVFRCIDGIMIDGNDRGLSKHLYRSCCLRDVDVFREIITSDMSWLTEYPENPLAVGQYVNNHTKEFPANVAYQEFDVPENFPFDLRQYIPNTWFSTMFDEKYVRVIRTVVLVATRDISQGEELFSTYFTVVHDR